MFVLARNFKRRSRSWNKRHWKGHGDKVPSTSSNAEQSWNIYLGIISQIWPVPPEPKLSLYNQSHLHSDPGGGVTTSQATIQFLILSILRFTFFISTTLYAPRSQQRFVCIQEFYTQFRRWISHIIVSFFLHIISHLNPRTEKIPKWTEKGLTEKIDNLEETEMDRKRKWTICKRTEKGLTEKIDNLEETEMDRKRKWTICKRTEKGLTEIIWKRPKWTERENGQSAKGPKRDWQR